MEIIGEIGRSDRVCHFCARKIIINSFELNFSNLQKEKQATI